MRAAWRLYIGNFYQANAFAGFAGTSGSSARGKIGELHGCASQWGAGREEILNSSMRIGWLDFSDEERRKVNTILQLLEEKRDLDELGLAPIRDGFANLFFPGMSTLVNRAKYFLIVPYALKELEKNPGGNLPDRLRAIERECGEILVQGKDNASVIGKNSLKHGGWVAQSPSEMYWGPLRSYGIFRKEGMSLAGCLRLLEATAQPPRGPRGRMESDSGVTDDADAGTGRALGLWDPALPYKAGWRENLRIGLKRNEAEFLKTRIVATAGTSMLGHILKNTVTEFVDCHNFFELREIIGLFPSHMQADYELARAFSLFALALRSAFALVLSRDRDPGALQWQEENSGKLPRLARIDVAAIFTRLKLAGNEHSLLKSFLEAAKTAMLRDDLAALKNLVAKREQQIKQRPKSLNPEPILDWAGRYALSYRFGNCLNVCNDIFAGLGLKVNANA